MRHFGAWAALILFSVEPLLAQARSIAVSGMVRDASSGEPIVAASVILDSLVVAATNEEGLYEAPDLSVSTRTLTLLFRRIGYASTPQDVVVPDTSSSLEVNVTLFPAPTNVERMSFAESGWPSRTPAWLVFMNGASRDTGVT